MFVGAVLLDKRALRGNNGPAKKNKDYQASGR
jgi:hypothetical protein